MPALCVPLKGVTVGAQPACAASDGALNHSPTVQPGGAGLQILALASGNGRLLNTSGAAVTLGATMNVSTLNRPMK